MDGLHTDIHPPSPPRASRPVPTTGPVSALAAARSAVHSVALLIPTAAADGRCAISRGKLEMRPKMKPKMKQVAGDKRARVCYSEKSRHAPSGATRDENRRGAVSAPSVGSISKEKT
jgi:hypothetical protein